MEQDDLKNLQFFLRKVTITGEEALPLVLLQQKIAKLLEPKPEKVAEEKKK